MTIAAQRLVNHGLEPVRFDTPLEVVRWLGAVQAQDYASGLWSVACRMREPSVSAIERAIESGEIVRTWPMRGTLHFVPGADAHWMLNLLAGRQAAAEATIQKSLAITTSDLERAAETLASVLQGGRRLARPALLAEFEAAGINTAGQRGYHILRHHAQARLICVGTQEGRQPTFQLLDELVPDPNRLTTDESLATLATRYFTSHGPTTLDNLCSWTKLTVREARRAVELAGEALATIEHEGRTLIAAPREPVPGGPTVHLLAPFDEYVLGYRDKRDVLRPEYADAICPGGNGVFKPTLVVDGHVRGTWSRTVRRATVTVTVEPLEPLSAEQLDLAEQAARRYALFLEMDLAFEVAARD